ncbi:Serine/threonine phosphatase stp [compost metagenome]
MVFGETPVISRELTSLATGAVTLQGPRPANEDSIWLDAQRGLYLVADGIGGPGKGDLASQMLVSLLESTLQTKPQAPLDEVVTEALSLANRKIIAAFLGDPALKGLGSTVTLALIEGSRLRLWHVGDSRAYLLRGKKLTCLTEDHTLARVLEKMGQTPPEKGAHTLVRCLGKDAKCTFDTVDVTLEPGDRLLLCTDGVYRNWPEDEVVKLAASEDLTAIAQDLAQGAIDRGGTDNASILVLGWDGESQASGGESLDHLLTRLTQDVESAGGFEAVVAAVVSASLDLTAGERGFLITVDPTRPWVAFDANGKLHELPPYSRTIAQWVMERQEPVWITNVLEDARFKDAGSLFNQGPRAVACAPFVAGGKVLAVLYIDRPAVSPADPASLTRLVQASSSYLALALSAWRFEERSRRLESLVGLGTTLSSACGVEETLTIVLKHCMSLTRATEGAIFEGGSQDWLAAIDSKGQSLGEFAFDGELIARVLKGSESELVIGGGATTTTTAVGLDLSTTICAPIRSSGKNLGVVYLKANSLVTDLTEHDLDLVTELLGFGAPFIEAGRKVTSLMQSNEQLSQALSRVQHTLGETSDVKLEGSLAEMRLEDVVSAHLQAKSSGWLKLEGPQGAEGAIGLKDGSLVSSRTGLADMVPEVALGELMSWEQGSFRFEQGPVEGAAMPLAQLYKAVEDAPRWRAAKARVPVHAVPVMLMERDIEECPVEQWQILQYVDGKNAVKDLSKITQFPLLNVMEAILELQASCTLYIQKA